MYKRQKGNTMSEITLEIVDENEINQLYKMQVESFMPLYKKYHDEVSPAIEPVEKVRGRVEAPERKYYFIVKDGDLLRFFRNRRIVICMRSADFIGREKKRLLMRR